MSMLFTKEVDFHTKIKILIIVRTKSFYKRIVAITPVTF